MSPKQVERFTGVPTKVEGTCWLFKPKDGMVGSISMGARGSLAARSTGDLKLCFYGGVFSSAFRHYRLHGKSEWLEWRPYLGRRTPTVPDNVG